MLAEILDRDSQALSASQTWRQALADADHLAVLNATWAAETSGARDQRYRDLLKDALPPGYPLNPATARSGCGETLRAAELAGLDARQVLADAVASRDLDGADDIAAVINARIRRRAGILVPLPAPAWSDQLPDIGDPERARLRSREIAALMDARKERIGEHAAATALPWAVAALGRGPADPATRLEWQRRAASVGAYRELSGYDAPRRPDRPRTRREQPGPARRLARGPGRARPRRRPRRPRHDRRPAPPPARHLPRRNRLGAPLGRRRTPPGPRRRPRRPPGRSSAPPPKPAPPAAAATARQGRRQQALAASYQAMHDAYRQRETALAVAMDDRADWERATRHQRQLAVAADAELRRRHPNQPWPPLRSAEPEPADSELCHPRKTRRRLRGLIDDLAARHREFTAKLADRQSIKVPAEDPDYEGLTPAFPAWAPPGRDAILQPPKPEITPSPRVLERVPGVDLDREPAG